MKKIFISLLCLLAFTCFTWAQEASVNQAAFHLGDDPAWKAMDFDDSSWSVLQLDKEWDFQGFSNKNGYGWYRIHLFIPSSLKKNCPFPGKLVLELGCIDDCDETWLNGVLVGKTGSFPADPAGYDTEYDIPRRYMVTWDQVKWDQENIIAVRVYNGGNPGGFYQGPVKAAPVKLFDVASLTAADEGKQCVLTFESKVKTSGTLLVEGEDVMTNTVDKPYTRKVKLNPAKPTVISLPISSVKRIHFTYTDNTCGEQLSSFYSTRYILTPKAPDTPRYNGPAVFGVRPGSPVIFRLAFSGEKPMKFEVEGLPEGVVLDADKGVLSGSVARRGDYPLVLKATNAKGSAQAEFTLRVGDKIGLTPPMGWNSWNCWGLEVSQQKVMASASAFINRGLADYGYSYINIDDAWEAEERTPDGLIQTNEKFPDIKGLGDWLHSNGLKLGIYSSPGDRTCGDYLGSLDHELQDAQVWNSWGVDYLKYDWCGYRKVFEPEGDESVAAYMRPYVKMRDFLRQQPRDIFYSLCQYGMSEVWTWGTTVDANSWRTTGDITDTWESLYSIGFEQQINLHPYASPGHWNDPDMLVVGKVGWSNNLRDSRLTPDEQYTHISLWSLLAANMLIGCDLSQIDDFTFNLLCNNEVNAVNQDVLGKQAHKDIEEDGVQMWSRPLSDGGIAVGIFNLNDQTVPVLLSGALGKIGIQKETVRDLWRQIDIPTAGEYMIPPHGVLYVKVK